MQFVRSLSLFALTQPLSRSLDLASRLMFNSAAAAAAAASAESIRGSPNEHRLPPRLLSLAAHDARDASLSLFCACKFECSHKEEETFNTRALTNTRRRSFVVCWPISARDARRLRVAPVARDDFITSRRRSLCFCLPPALLQLLLLLLLLLLAGKLAR